MAEARTVKISVRLKEDEFDCLKRWEVEKRRRGKKSSISDQVSLCIVMRRIAEEKARSKA